MEQKVIEKLWKIANSQSGRSEYFIRLEYGKPLGLRTLFEKQYESFFLELGSGWGEVALELAKRQPNVGFVLMEKNIGRVKTTLKKLKQKNLENIRFIPMNFHWFLDSIFLPEQFSTILLNFPDPWPKKKHHKHRTVNSQFMDIMYTLLTYNGKFLFATDYGGYAREVIRLFRKQDKFGYETNEYSFQRKNFPISRFEEEKRNEGKRIYYIERTKLPK
jgi:tRNA (guanine-N7-)-methyltransferase